MTNLGWEIFYCLEENSERTLKSKQEEEIRSKQYCNLPKLLYIINTSFNNLININFFLLSKSNTNSIE